MLEVMAKKVPVERHPTVCWGDVSGPMLAYHDDEWGKPVHDSRALWEKLMLDGFQAGLSWEIILNKREGFARAFEGWQPERIAAYGEEDVARLLADPGIVRNRLKVRGVIRNARAYLRLKEAGSQFSDYLWAFPGREPIDRMPSTRADVPATSPESDAMSRALQSAGFTFVGSTICYAFMQAVGMVNDHLASCPARTI